MWSFKDIVFRITETNGISRILISKDGYSEKIQIPISKNNAVKFSEVFDKWAKEIK